jgi:hypothetical protein
MNDSLRDLVARLGADCELQMRVELTALDMQDFEVAAMAVENAEADSTTAFMVCRASFA